VILWSEIESAVIVLGDMVFFKIGDIVHPADCRLTVAINVSIDQASALTGETPLVFFVVFENSRDLPPPLSLRLPASRFRLPVHLGPLDRW
jgi:hypothetical protein